MSQFKKFLIALIVVGFCFSPVFVLATTGTIDSTNRYAYGEDIGWVDFGSSQGNVTVTDTALTGYAWSENAGWISLNCANDNDNCSPSYKISNDGSGNLSGYAYSENLGWIDFNPTGGGVVIGPTSGVFSGWAYGENAGWISFSCSTSGSCTNEYKVTTDWRKTFVVNAGGSGWTSPEVVPVAPPPTSTPPTSGATTQTVMTAQQKEALIAQLKQQLIALLTQLIQLLTLQLNQMTR